MRAVSVALLLVLLAGIGVFGWPIARRGADGDAPDVFLAAAFAAWSGVVFGLALVAVLRT